MVGNLPMKKWRVSNLEGVIWNNRKEMNGVEVEFKTATIGRSYRKKGEDLWRNEVINNIRLNDIPKLQAILNRLQDFLYFEAREAKEESEDDE